MMEKSDYFVILALILFAISLFYLAYSGINIGDLMSDLVLSYYEKFGGIGIYLGIFLISIIGNVTFIFPVPYVLTLGLISILLPVNILLLGIFAGLGAAIGEVSAWLVGFGAKELVEETRYASRIKRLKKMVEDGFAIPLIILFAATPLPDDLLLFVLGITQYSILKTILTCFIGKVILCVGISWIVKSAAYTHLGSQILSLYGIGIAEGTLYGTENPWVPAISLFLTTAIFILLVMIDWEKILKKIKR